jgi:DHA1 family inner membrane transport protein
MHGPGLEALPWVAALVPLSAFLVALRAIALERRHDRFALVEQTQCP